MECRDIESAPLQPAAKKAACTCSCEPRNARFTTSATTPFVVMERCGICRTKASSCAESDESVFHPQRAGLEAMILAPWSSDGYPFQTDRIFRVPEKSEKSLCI